MHAAGLQWPPPRWGTTPPQPPALLHPAAASALQWNVTGDYVNSPFASPYPPYVIRTTEGTDPDRIVLVSGGGGNSGQWQLKAYEADSGAEAWSAMVAAPDAANAGLTTLTSGLPHWQQLNNSLGLIFMQLGTYVVAVDGATGQQRWQHATYNASTPKITGYRCAGRGRDHRLSVLLSTLVAVPGWPAQACTTLPCRPCGALAAEPLMLPELAAAHHLSTLTHLLLLSQQLPACLACTCCLLARPTPAHPIAGKPCAHTQRPRRPRTCLPHVQLYRQQPAGAGACQLY